MSATSADVHALLSAGGGGKSGSLLPHQRRDVLGVLRDFVDANEDARTSPNYRSETRDEMRAVFDLLASPECARDEEVCVYALKFLKIASRKEPNRRAFGRHGVAAVLRPLRDPTSARVAAEASNVILNACYEKENVEHVLECGGAEPLVRLVSHDAEPVRANALGAVQSVCFRKTGRAKVRELGGVAAILEALERSVESGNLDARTGTGTHPSAGARTLTLTRAAGAAHNVSGDAESIRLFRAAGRRGVPLLVSLLRSDVPEVAGSAAGAIQNLSRERACRRLIRVEGAIPALGDLLVAGDPVARASAAGALLNILGPELGDDDGHKGDAREVEGSGTMATKTKTKTAEGRRALGKLISSALALSAAWEALYESTPDPEAGA